MDPTMQSGASSQLQAQMARQAQQMGPDQETFNSINATFGVPNPQERFMGMCTIEGVGFEGWASIQAASFTQMAQMRSWAGIDVFAKGLTFEGFADMEVKDMVEEAAQKGDTEALKEMAEAMGNPAFAMAMAEQEKEKDLSAAMGGKEQQEYAQMMQMQQAQQNQNQAPAPFEQAAAMPSSNRWYDMSYIAGSHEHMTGAYKLSQPHVTPLGGPFSQHQDPGVFARHY